MGSLPLMSLMSTVAWASRSNESSSVVPVRAAWCSAEKLWATHIKNRQGLDEVEGQESVGRRETKVTKWVINHSDDSKQQVNP